MLFMIQTLALFFAAICLSQAQLAPYFYPYTSQETAVSLNNAPVGLYGRTSDIYGGSEEYGVSLGGAPVGIYGKRRQSNPSPYFLPTLWDYWSMMYALDYYRNSVPYDFPYFPPLLKNDPLLPIVAPWGFQESISAASLATDSAREKTPAEGISLQGDYTSDIFHGILEL